MVFIDGISRAWLSWRHRADFARTHRIAAAARAHVSNQRADLLAGLSSMNAAQGGAVVRGTALLVLGFGFQAAAVLCS